MGVEKIILSEGTGPKPTKGQTIVMNYTGWLKDTSKPNSRGGQFDSSFNEGREPLKSRIGVGKLIPGWDEAVLNMKVGEKAVLDITSDYGYGAGGYGPIPPKSDLIFEVELLGIE